MNWGIYREDGSLFKTCDTREQAFALAALYKGVYTIKEIK